MTAEIRPPVIAPADPLAGFLTTILAAQSSDQQTPPLVIAPGDSATVVSAKIKAFTLATIVELLDTLPLPKLDREVITAAVAKAQSPQVETDASSSPQAPSKFERVLADITKQLRLLPAELDRTLVKNILQTLPLQSSPLDIHQPLPVIQQRLAQVFESVLPQQLYKAFEAMTPDVERPWINTLQKQILAALAPQVSPTEGAPVRDISEPEVKQIVLSALKDFVAQVVRTQTGETDNKFSTLILKPKDWELVVKLQGLVAESEFEQTSLSMPQGNPPLPEQVKRTSAERQMPTLVANRELRELFFTIEASAARSQIAPTSVLASKVLVSQELPHVTPQAAQTFFANQLTTPIDLNSIASMLASRLVAAYRLAPDITTRRGRNQQYSKTSSTKDKAGWLLRFLVNQDEAVDARVELDDDGKASVELEHSDPSIAKTFAQQGRQTTARLGLSWLLWKGLDSN